MLEQPIRRLQRCVLNRRQRYGLILSLLVLLDAAGAQEPALEPLPDDLPRHFGVVGMRLAGSGDNLRVTHVRVDSPADHAGVLEGDRLRGADAYRLTSLQETLDYIQSLPPDSSVVLHLRRKGEPLQLSCGVTDRQRLYGLMIEQRRPPPGLLPRHDRWLDTPGTVQHSMEQLLTRLGANDALADLLRAFGDDAVAYGHDTRLADVDFALLHPTAAARPITDLADRLSAGTLAERVGAMASRLDVDVIPLETSPDTVFAALTASSLYPPLLGVLWRAGRLSHQALPDTTPGNLGRAIHALLDRFDKSLYLDEENRQETHRHQATLRWAKKVDVGLMAASLIELSHLGTPDQLRRIRDAAKGLPHIVDADLPAAFTGEIRFAQPTSWGWVVVGGKGANVYGEDAAVIIDLGGDDLYLGGARVHAQAPVALVVDLGGDDRYVDRRLGGVVGAVGGVVALIDVKGDDVYEGGTLGVASAFGGAALLLDREGDDIYLGDVMTQGSAMFGVALLHDMKGSDLYSAARFAQGFAGPRAIAAVVDSKGNDHYVTDRSRPSVYGTEGVYEGWAQGVGCGLRGFAAGGIGLLLDEEGHDRYQAGNFSQGVGYFFGLGGLVDRRGDDHYRATRYSQASSAHQAIGVLVDEEGDDAYEGQITANQGASWDASVAILVDLKGNDTYRGAGLSQGASAMNGFAALFDGKGDDVYRSPSGQADGGSTRYWGGRDAPNVAILIDEAGHDDYDREGRADGVEFLGSRIGLFRDTE
ncbi:MAG: PDZ domain-containing protein [Candidatus Latescibacteria bacterium]|jgi:hypothetical protein|nr:PDZ domain-containing protein [Candidatus Latescibacterota bacterium]